MTLTDTQRGGGVDDFLTQVREKASQLSSNTEAEAVTNVVLEVLADAVSVEQMAELLKSVPDLLTPSGKSVAGNPDQIDVQHFLKRVQDESEFTDEGLAEPHARAVLSTVAEWVPGDQLDDTLAQLPKSLQDLFAVNP